MSNIQSFLELQGSEGKRHTNPQLQLRVIRSLMEEEGRVGDPEEEETASRRQVESRLQGTGKWGSCLLTSSEPGPIKRQSPLVYLFHSSCLMKSLSLSPEPSAFQLPASLTSKNAFLSSLVNAFAFLFHFVIGLLTRRFHLFTTQNPSSAVFCRLYNPGIPSPPALFSAKNWWRRELVG